jgi:hypothetical protein
VILLKQSRSRAGPAVVCDGCVTRTSILFDSRAPRRLR